MSSPAGRLVALAAVPLLLLAACGDDDDGDTSTGAGGGDQLQVVAAFYPVAEAADPHFWLDPQLMADAVDEIGAALGDAAPADAEAFGAGAQRYDDELATLDQEMEAGLSGCERDEIVTSHAAFYYLANRYGLTQLPIAGLSPESEPDADRLAELADRVEEDGITTVFYEDLVSPDVAETLARE